MNLPIDRSPIAIDLFAGAGGLGEGLARAGVQVAVATELHPQPALTYAFNHPTTKVLVGDIRDLSMAFLGNKVAETVGHARVDIVVGGPPCQGFSTAGKKIISDPRNDMFRQFARVVDHFRPRMFLLENVPGFKKMYHGKAYEELTELLIPLGYEVTHAVVNAAFYGVPQRRLRFVMVGWQTHQALPFAWPCPTHEEVLVETQQLLFPSLSAPFVTVADALEDIAFLEPGWECHRQQDVAHSEYQRARRTDCDLIFNHLASRHRPKTVKMFSQIREGATISSVPQHLRSEKRTMARLDHASIANAVLAMPDDMIHYRHDRIPTVREMARLQSFDDDYVFFGKRTSGFVERRVDVPQYTQVGNAVPPLLSYALGKSLIASLGGTMRDIRNLHQRRSFHRLVCGSSGFSGYTLDPAIEGHVVLESIGGEILPLPLSEDDIKVQMLPALEEWTERPNPKRGQWAPGIVPRDTPAHVAPVDQI